MRPQHLIAVATGVAGLVAGWAIGNTLGRPGEVALDQPTTSTRPAIEPSTLGNQVRALQGWELIVARATDITAAGATAVETWQSDWQTPSARDTPGELRLVAWNSDGSRIGGLDTAPRPVLYMGRGTAMEPVAVAVTSFAWHVTDPDVLVWTGDSGDLWRWNLESDPALVASQLGTGAMVVAAADWGYAVIHEGVMTKLGPEGDVRDGTAAHLSPGFGFPTTGRPIVILGEEGTAGALLNPLTGQRVDLDAAPSHAMVAPDGSRYAVTSPGGLGRTRVQVRDEGTVELDITIPESVFLDWQGNVIVMAQLQEEPASVGTGTARPLYFLDLGASAAVRVEYDPGFIAGAVLRER
ncbi:MAG: hypothetical protein ACE5E8_05670 [Acidimicrobiia bacterium]